MDMKWRKTNQHAHSLSMFWVLTNERSLRNNMEVALERIRKGVRQYVRCQEKIVIYQLIFADFIFEVFDYLDGNLVRSKLL